MTSVALMDLIAIYGTMMRDLQKRLSDEELVAFTRYWKSISLKLFNRLI
jgi:hypothetical protein